MDYNFDFLRDTININKEEMEGSPEATNDLLVGDIMLALGYNRKRDPNVKKLYNEEIDWRIQKNTNNIGVKVLSLGQEVVDVYSNLDINIVTNGVELLIKIKDNPKDLRLNLLELDESGLKILTDLSYETFNMESLDAITSYRLATLDDFKNTIEKYELLPKMYLEAIELLGVDDAEENKIRFNSLFNINKLDETNDKAEVDRLNLLIKQLNNDIAELKETTNVDTVKSNSDLEFRHQIEILHREKSEQQNEIKRLGAEINKLKNKLQNSKETNKNEALGLLNSIEDNPDEPKAYVGVINNKLYRQDTIQEFIGNSIEYLYELESFNLMPLLFDGDIFKIQPSISKGHFAIGVKEYNIDVTNENEEVLLIKLQTLFNKFKDVSFAYKIVGNKEQEMIAEYDEEDADDIFGGVLENEYDVEIADEFTNAETDEKMDDDENEEDYELQIEDVLKIKDTELNEEGTEGIKTKLSIKIAKIADVMWNNDVSNINIKEIMIGSNRYKIDNTLKLNQQLIEIIKAIMTNISDLDEAIKKLSRLDLSGISVVIKPVGQNVTGIPFSKFGVENFDNVGMMVPIINTLIDALSVDKTNIELLIEADVDSKSDLFKYNVDTRDITEYDNEDAISLSGDTGVMVISGNVTDLTLFNNNVTTMYQNLITSCLAIKTNYMQERLDTMDGREKAYEQILANYKGDIKQLADALGSPLGEKHKIMSLNKDDVSDDSLAIDVLGKQLFVTELNPFELTFTLLRLHSFINKDKSIGIQVEIDLGGLEYYTKQFITTDANKKLTVHALLNYIQSRIKK